MDATAIKLLYCPINAVTVMQLTRGGGEGNAKDTNANFIALNLVFFFLVEVARLQHNFAKTLSEKPISANAWKMENRRGCIC